MSPRGDNIEPPSDDGIIENLSALDINEAGETHPANEEAAEVLSLSSATSATSVASALSDGAPRPRSASLGMPARPSSTPRLRPRSNPRTRTPMRRPSPLLVTGDARDVEAANMNEGRAANNESENEGGRGSDESIRNIFNARRQRSQSIPEEREEEGDELEPAGGDGASNDAHRSADDPNSEGASAAPPPSAPRAAGHLFARAATTNAASERNARSTNPTRSRAGFPGLSDKQRPSHRKLRRWNNDRFVGTSSEQLHVQLEGESGAADLNWREHYMPNYPQQYRSEFARLSVDETTAGRGVRDRFLRGEVAHRGEGGEDATRDVEQSAAAKFRKKGLFLNKMAGSEESVRDEMGKTLYRKLSPRIQSVVSRSCALEGDGRSSAGEVIAAFESYLVSLALVGSKKDVTSFGYPPLHPQGVYDVLDDVLSRPPHIVVRGRKSCHGAKHAHAVLVPAVHFYFPAEGDDGEGGSGSRHGRSSAFHRILLHAVCQFHGLESSSSILAPGRKNEKSARGNGRGCLKVVTVQRGILLAPALKLLDFVDDE
ncbi:hypothetical protein ACHAXT_013318 [Thalassiosira profunda]